MIATPAKDCPICHRPTAATYAPFCSKRCSDIDLGRWLNEDYAIPVSKEDEDDAPDAADLETPGEERDEH